MNHNPFLDIFGHALCHCEIKQLLQCTTAVLPRAQQQLLATVMSPFWPPISLVTCRAGAQLPSWQGEDYHQHYWCEVMHLAACHGAPKKNLHHHTCLIFWPYFVFIYLFIFFLRWFRRCPL
mmetsp:Transcript_71787/g.164617  ORF Transcript_71787/g.164617 Transcript_71787/m.164617 type:complete len:121 (-) Transcript_71787:3-365(-)